ncbi:MAG: hypothetical protein FWC60_02385 [Firmicutes bacterium]|nr:hypothetical protein [Bacillota bacterium]
MEALRVLFVEDSTDPMRLIENLERYGCQVEHCARIRVAQHYVKKEPSFGHFDILLLDLALDSYDLPGELQKEAAQTFAGWVFYQYMIENETLKRNTIFYTAYAEEFKDKIGVAAYQKLQVVEKQDSAHLNKIIAAIYKLTGQKLAVKG